MEDNILTRTWVYICACHFEYGKRARLIQIKPGWKNLKRHAWFGLDVKRTKKPITLTFEDKTKLATLICKYYSGIYEKVISSKLKWQSLANTSMSTIK